MFTIMMHFVTENKHFAGSCKSQAQTDDLVPGFLFEHLLCSSHQPGDLNAGQHRPHQEESVSACCRLPLQSSLVLQPSSKNIGKMIKDST